MKGDQMELKLTIQEFGEVSYQIMDAFERGEKEIPTDLGIKLLGHIQAILKEQIEMNQRFDKIIELGLDGLQGFDRHERYPVVIRRMMKLAQGEK
jgi:hypothetical protein